MLLFYSLGYFTEKINKYQIGSILRKQSIQIKKKAQLFIHEMVSTYNKL